MQRQTAPWGSLGLAGVKPRASGYSGQWCPRLPRGREVTGHGVRQPKEAPWVWLRERARPLLQRLAMLFCRPSGRVYQTA